MESSVIRDNGKKEIIKLSPDIFDVKYNEILLHQLVVSYLGNSHQRTKMYKSRSQVRGGGKKPWNQKGSGRARVGSIRSPLWRGGGQIFAADASVNGKRKINKKMYNLGMKVIFSELFRSKRLSIINNIKCDKCNTKDFLSKLSYLNIKTYSLFIVENFDLNIYFSSRNIKNILVISSKDVNPTILLKFKFVYITESVIKYIEERFK